MKCKCCGLVLNKAEIAKGQTCFHCIKGNCEICGPGEEEALPLEDESKEI